MWKGDKASHKSSQSTDEGTRYPIKIRERENFRGMSLCLWAHWHSSVFFVVCHGLGFWGERGRGWGWETRMKMMMMKMKMEM